MRVSPVVGVVSTMGKLGQNLQVGERVTMNRTTDHELDGHKGTILGTSAKFAECAFYIVLLDDPFLSGERAISLIESCIDRVLPTHVPSVVQTVMNQAILVEIIDGYMQEIQPVPQPVTMDNI